MKNEEKIIDIIIEKARKIGRLETQKDYFLERPIENTDKARKSHSEKLNEYEFEINNLATELNLFVWLFKENE